jgi:sugar lactone lactonase YvrE
LPNGLAFARNGDILISNFGTDCLEIMTRDGESRVLADSIDGEPIGKVNFVLRDSKDRIWITVSTRIRNWMHALRTDLADGPEARPPSAATLRCNRANSSCPLRLPVIRCLSSMPGTTSRRVAS